MKRLLPGFVAALFVCIPSGSARAGSPGLLGEDGTLASRFYADGEVLWVDRDGTPNREVGFDSALGGASVLETDDVVDNYHEFGGRGVLGFRLDPRDAAEIAFMGWGREHTENEVRFGETLNAFEGPDLGLIPTLSDNSFDDAAVFELDYEAHFYSGELNFRRAMEVEGADYRFNLLAGIRAIRLEEDLDFTSLDEFPVGAGRFGTHDVTARNTLIGGQLGVETLVPLYEDRLDFDLYLVAGAYANETNVTVDFFNGAPLRTHRESRVDWKAAGVFEAATHFSIRLYRGVRLKLGYRAVYLVGIAAAPAQFAKTGSPQSFFNPYDTDGSTIFHGPSAGVTIDF